ncbi:MAG: BrnT family toxin [Elusimicrobiota bacterium]
MISNTNFRLELFRGAPRKRGDRRKHPSTNPLISVHTVNKGFEWDERKCESNKLKHRASFAEAVESFGDPAAVRLPDIRHSTPREKREILIGRIIQGILVVIYTIRQPGSRIRIISARRANSKERRLYEAEDDRSRS